MFRIARLELQMFTDGSSTAAVESECVSFGSGRSRRKTVGQKTKTKKHKRTYSTWLAARLPQPPELILMHISSINRFPRTLHTFANSSAMDSQRHTAVMRLRTVRGCPCLELVVVVPLLRSVSIAGAALFAVALCMFASRSCKILHQ